MYVLVFSSIITVLGNASIAPNEEWIKEYDNSKYFEEIDIVQQTRDGGYLIGGQHGFDGVRLHGADLWLSKTDANGNQLWSKSFIKFFFHPSFKTEDRGFDEGISILQVKDGYLILGRSEWPKSTLLIKTDIEGNEQWNQTFGACNSEISDGIHQTSDDGFIVACGKWLAKTDAVGHEQWNITMCGNAYSAQQTKDNGYIIAGETDCFGSGFKIKILTYDILEKKYRYVYDPWLFKIDAEGNEQWNRTFGKISQASKSKYFVRQTYDGGYIFAGNSDVLRKIFDHGTVELNFPQKIWLIKIDNKGNEQWNRNFGKGTSEDRIHSFDITSDGGYIISGQTKSYDDRDLFSWNKIPGDDDGRLIEFLEKDYGIDWVKSAKIEKKDYLNTGDGRTIRVYSEKNYVLLNLNDEKTGVFLNINDVNGKTDASFLAKTINGEQIIYETGKYYLDPILIRVDKDGNEIWNKTFGRKLKSEEISTYVSQTSDGGYIASEYGLGNSWLIKLASVEPISTVVKTTSTENKPPEPPEKKITSTVTPINSIKPVEKSTLGFSILVAVFSVVVIFLLKRKKD